MKVIILSEIEQFCKEHNFYVIGLKTLKEMAIEQDEDGLTKAYKAGYGQCCDAVINAMAAERPR